MKGINVTKTYLPDIKEYEHYLEQIWSSHYLTNQGPLLKQFEDLTASYLEVKNFHFVANGTLALQLALRALNITDGEIITTPFSYVATVSAILWERCTPRFVDIEEDTLCINPELIEQAITPKTKAIMGVHVFGNPCDVRAIQKISQKYNIPVIYDGAHAFGVTHKGQSLLSYGDIATCSFHATKLFHTVEGGCVITKDRKVSNNLELLKRFGHEMDEHIMLGINAKASELHAAMGLCNLKHIEEIIGGRKEAAEAYDRLLPQGVEKLKIRDNTKYNYAYYPVLVENEPVLKKLTKHLNSENIYPRRYFYPSLNNLSYLNQHEQCPVSEDITSRILCLPLYTDIYYKDIERVCREVTKGLGRQSV